MKYPCARKSPLQCRCVLAVLCTFCFALVHPALAEGDSEYLTIKELVEMGGEPECREKRTGKREQDWTSTEATECLRILLQGYERFGPSEGGLSDPDVERLMRILEAGHLQSFLYYELGATGMNQPILLSRELLLPDLEEYISEFVVVSTDTE